MTKKQTLKMIEKYGHIVNIGEDIKVFVIDKQMRIAFALDLLELIEQEKKETAREIFSQVFNNTDLGEYCGVGWIYSVYEVQELAKKYGVEL